MMMRREEELNMVNGGIANARMLGASKFNEGDKVISKSHPEGGVGTVVKKEYNKGWWYDVRMQGGNLYTSENDLQSPLIKA